MSNKAGSKSIAEVIAEAEKQKAEAARREAKAYAQRRQAEAQASAASVAQARKTIAAAKSGKVRSVESAMAPRTAAPATPASDARAATPAGSKSDDWRDEFEYAIEAVETARKALGRDMGAVEKMATNLLVAKAGVSRNDAPRFIRKAIDYLGS